ncbi:MAG: hypothetical protein ACOYS2_00120, partial [Patescibacteria group bacterium]
FPYLKRRKLPRNAHTGRKDMPQSKSPPTTAIYKGIAAKKLAADTFGLGTGLTAEDKGIATIGT